MATTTKFNLEMFKNGMKAQTKLGNPVKFITVSARGELIISVRPRYGMDEMVKYTIDGHKMGCGSTMYDLEMVNPYVTGPLRDEKGRFIKMK